MPFECYCPKSYACQPGNSCLEWPSLPFESVAGKNTFCYIFTLQVLQIIQQANLNKGGLLYYDKVALTIPYCLITFILIHALCGNNF